MAHLDIRTQARTEASDLIYLFYPGILKMDDTTQNALQWSPDAKTTRSEDHYSMTTPKFETSSTNLKWMEQFIFIGHGYWHIPGDGTQVVEYEIFKVLSVGDQFLLTLCHVWMLVFGVAFLYIQVVRDLQRNNRGPLVTAMQARHVRYIIAVRKPVLYEFRGVRANTRNKRDHYESWIPQPVRS